ncbi:YhdP family protein [Methylophilus sp. VKM B-3414]|uniref:YhdP family protein n=1 Tax=Methylophilus sp. VKM B-3414 TaxID=3076121 RepID=UPI0028C6609A|nr:YhdP family protein [Methylophilus sp. VKM B-3414]MDT7848345.1 YhdP family protein [Methylophilus sp. VKM B-3414]
MPLQKIKRWLLSLLIGLLILLAGIVGVIQFYVFPHIDDYRSRIEHTLSDALKQNVTIASIAIRWRGLAPQVTLGKVTLYDTQQRPALELAQVTTRLSWSSLALLSPSLVSLNIDAPNLVVRRTAEGQVFLAGISMSGQGNPAFANWLLSQRRIKISNATVTWLDEQRHAPPLLLKDLNIQILTPVWQRLLHRHSIHVDSLVSTGTKQRIHLEAVAVGDDVSKPEAWHGELSLRLPETDLAAWSPWIDLPVALTAGKGNLTATLAFDKLQLQRLAAQVALNHVAVSPARTSQTFIAKTVSGEVRWQRVEQRQMLTLKHFSADIEPGLMLSDANGEVQWDQHGHEGTLSLKQLGLTHSNLLAQWLPADAALTRYLENMVPTGNASKVKARWLYHDKQWQDYAITASFDHIQTKAYEKLPGLQNWAGQLSVKPNAGNLELDTKEATLELAGLLRWPLPIDQLQGEIEWRNNGQKMLISTHNLHFANPHLALRTNMEYQLGATGGDTIQLQSQIERGDAKFASFYYPLVLDQATLHWLDTSILSGQIRHGEVIVKGRVKDFPYVNAAFHSDPSLGLFRVTAQLDRASLEYGTDWPQLQDIDAFLKFEGKRMDIAVKNATTVGQHITQAQVEIPRLDADDPILSVKAVATGNLEQGIKFINTSPVKQVTMGFTDTLKATGAADLKLALQIPLNNVDASQFQGDYAIKNGHIAANTQMAMPEMGNINGHLKFNEKGLQAQGIQLSLFDNPATLSLSTRPDKSVMIQGSGRITDAALRKLDNNLLTRALHGTTDWKSNVLIQAPNLRLDIRSQLIGMTIDLPEPAKKTADTPANLIIRVRQENNQPDKIAIDYNEWLHANLFRQVNGETATITAGEIAINTPARLPTGNGINLRADFQKLNIDEWLPYLNQSGTPQNSATSSLALNQVELTAGTLHVFDRNLHQIKLNITPESERLKLLIQGQELAGEADWLAGKPNKLVARLNYLRVPRTPDNDTTPAPAEARRLDMTYPELDITAQDFQFGDKQLGSLDLKAFNSGESWVIQRMSITNPDSQLTADGTWRNSVRSPQTQLKFNLNSSNLGKTLQRFQPGGEMVKGGTGNMNGQLSWPGSPHEFAVERLDGSFTMQLEKGQILKVQPGVGRLLGLLSLQSLPRRLTLDFHDLFSEGFAFDKITSTANIRDGILRSDDLFMTGPAAEARIKGETNLKAETQRLKVRVVPHISDSVSLAALAGGPIVGVAAFVAQKLLKDPLNKISASEYMITGTWDNPQEADADKKAPATPAVQPLKNLH